jgi:hypothetical protein
VKISQRHNRKKKEKKQNKTSKMKSRKWQQTTPTTQLRRHQISPHPDRNFLKQTR